MKKMSTFTKKLLFSALALGLAVVTLTTTTFAWYTTSTTTTATAGSSTSGTTSDSTLLISGDYHTAGEGATWGRSVTISTGSSLVPVQWNGSAFVTLDEKTTAPSDYYQFTISFKTTKSVIAGQENPAIPVYLKSFVLENTASTLAAHDNLLGINNGVAGAPTSKDYKIDAIRALDLLIENGGTKTPYDLSGTQEATIKKDAESGFTSIAAADALDYYNAVTFASDADYLTRPTAATTLKVDGTFVLTSLVVSGSSYGVQTVTFTIFLNGWDQYCFDACKGQNFTLNMSFATK